MRPLRQEHTVSQELFYLALFQLSGLYPGYDLVLPQGLGILIAQFRIIINHPGDLSPKSRGCEIRDVVIANLLVWNRLRPRSKSYE